MWLSIGTRYMFKHCICSWKPNTLRVGFLVLYEKSNDAGLVVKLCGYYNVIKYLRFLLFYVN